MTRGYSPHTSPELGADRHDGFSADFLIGQLLFDFGFGDTSPFFWRPPGEHSNVLTLRRFPHLFNQLVWLMAQHSAGWSDTFYTVYEQP